MFKIENFSDFLADFIFLSLLTARLSAAFCNLVGFDGGGQLVGQVHVLVHPGMAEVDQHTAVRCAHIEGVIDV